MTNPTWFEWITIAAIVLGPVLALFIRRILDGIREKRERRVQLFLTLMRTRATPLAPDHVNALNSIEVVFDGENDRRIREAWHKLLTHIVADASHPTWQERYNDLKVVLRKFSDDNPRELVGGFAGLAVGSPYHSSPPYRRC